MITGYVRRPDFRDLTKAEAKAFILFLIMEADRHREDIKTIEEDILEIRRIQRIMEKEEKRKNGKESVK
jgi:hypothetical protein